MRYKIVDAKLLSLDNTLADYLPELATRIEHANKITLRTMVNHTSGIPNYSDQEGFDWSENIPNVLDLVLDKPANFVPGEDYAYSNTNYLLLNTIMRRVLGYPHTEYIRNEVLVPLGLSNTYFSVNDIEPSKIMSGYHVGHETDWKHLEQGFVASAEDVGIFIRALNDGSLFNGNEKAIYDTIYVYEHTGWVLGYSSIARYHKDIDTVVIQFTSTTGDDRVMLTSIIYERIMRILRGD